MLTILIAILSLLFGITWGLVIVALLKYIYKE